MYYKKKMSFLNSELVKDLGDPESLNTRMIKPQVSTTVAVAETFEFEIPQDALIHAIFITIGEDTTVSATTRGTLADDILDIELAINGYLKIKNMKGTMNKCLAIMNRHVALGTGFYQLDFIDQRIKASKPLPTFLPDITSITLKITDNAPAALNYHHINVTLLEQKCNEDMKKAAEAYPTLMESYPKKKSWGTDTLWQEYEHMKNHQVYAYLYELGDAGTLEDPAVDGFDYIRIEGRSPAGFHPIMEKTSLLDMKQMNLYQYLVALPTGYVAYAFPRPLNTTKYSNLYTNINIHTAAATNAELRCLERFLLY